MPAQIEKTASGSLSEDDVLRQIEQAVLDHRLPPGTKLKEVQLANLFGVKRGMIRKVLTRLAHSRLVDQTPNRGATVARPSVKEGQDLFAARRAIESAILETLIARCDEQMLSRLRKMLEREAKAYRRGDSEKALALSVDFHRQLAALAGNGVLEAFLNDIIRRTPLVILTHLGDDEQNRCRNREHAEIVEAIERRDTRRAVKVMHQHLLHIESKIRHKPEARKADLATLLRQQPEAAAT
ncbi:MAG: GntR family transcriptional regulator [Gammaproteobacteria bacterium]|nr:GntR family transcriptional regulator [Gammaproteobacteria bacterium]MDH3446796.1 GntR family transcriptional regulator [Gammaproteobacteria bacterium]